MVNDNIISVSLTKIVNTNGISWQRLAFNKSIGIFTIDVCEDKFIVVKSN